MTNNIPNRTDMVASLNDSIDFPSGCWKDFNNDHKKWQRMFRMKTRPNHIKPFVLDLEVPEEPNINDYSNLDENCL